MVLPPLAGFAGDPPALDLDHSDTDARPGHHQIRLVFPIALQQADRVEQGGMSRQLVPQRLPNPPFRPTLIGKRRLRRETSRHARWYHAAAADEAGSDRFRSRLAGTQLRPWREAAHWSSGGDSGAAANEGCQLLGPAG